MSEDARLPNTYRGVEPYVRVGPGLRCDVMVARLEQLSTDAGEYRGGVECRIASWSWSPAAGSAHREEPFFERRDARAVRRVASHPGRAPEAGDREYGWDGDGRIVLTQIVGRDGQYEAWLTESESVEVDWTGLAVAVRRTQREAGRLVAFARCWTEGRRSAPGWVAYAMEEYRYADGCLAEIRSEATARSPTGWEQPRRKLWLVQRRGRRVSVEPSPVVAAEPPELDAAVVADLEARISEGLVAEIPAHVAAHADADPVYMISLCWWGGGTDVAGGFTATVSIGTEPERDALLRSDRPYRPFDAYLADTNIRFRFELGALAADAAVLCLELLRRRESARIDAIQRAVERRLDRLDWSRLIPATDDIAVVGEIIGRPRRVSLKHLQASLSPERFAVVESLETARVRTHAARPLRHPPLARAKALPELRRIVGAAGVKPGLHTYPPGALSVVWQAYLTFLAMPIKGLHGDPDLDLALIDQIPRLADETLTVSLARQLARVDANGDLVGYDVVYINITLPARPDDPREATSRFSPAGHHSGGAAPAMPRPLARAIDAQEAVLGIVVDATRV